MSETLTFTGAEALDVFAGFLSENASDIELNAVFPEGIYHMKMQPMDLETEEGQSRHFKAIKTEKMTEPMPIMSLFFEVVNVITTTDDNPEKLKGRVYKEEIIVNEMSQGRVIQLAAATLGVSPKDFQDSEAAQIPMRDLLLALGGNEWVVAVKHKQAKNSDRINTNFDYSSKGVMMNPQAYFDAMDANAA